MNKPEFNKGSRNQGDQFKDLYPVNNQIRVPQIRLIDADHNNVGIVDIAIARNMARDQELDLVLINATSTPPVAKICNYNKFVYELKLHKKEQDRKLRENAIHIKEIQLRPGISEHDLSVKMNRAKEWLGDNCKIKIVLKFRGRELNYKAQGFNVINTFVEKLGCKVEEAPDINNNTIIAVVAPARNAIQEKVVSKT